MSPSAAEPSRAADTVTVPAAYVRTLLASVAEQGHDARAFAASESLSAADIAGHRVPAAAFGRLYQKAMWLLQDESLGMVSGGRVVSGTFRMLCLSAIGCEDIAAVVHRAGEFLDVARGVVVKPDLVPVGPRVRIGFAATRGSEDRDIGEILAEQDPLRVRTTLYLWHRLLGWFADRPLPLEEVRFAFPSPPNGERWSRLFGAPVTFDAEASALVLPAEPMGWPNVQNERSLETFLRSAPYRLIAPSRDAQTLTERVLALFGDDVSRPLPSAVEAGRRLGLSVSTLRRRLEEEGTSYQGLKDECRRTAAIRYLAARELSLAEISALLGFEEPSAFFRAFRRWTGTTPARYRASDGHAAGRGDRLANAQRAGASRNRAL